MLRRALNRFCGSSTAVGGSANVDVVLLLVLGPDVRNTLCAFWIIQVSEQVVVLLKSIIFIKCRSIFLPQDLFRTY